MAWPIPRAAPVTRLTLPDRSHRHRSSRSSRDQPRARVLDARRRASAGSARPGAPSTMRWSKVRLSVTSSRPTTRSPSITGCRVDPADAEDGALGRVDDRREGVDAERARGS